MSRKKTIIVTAALIAAVAVYCLWPRFQLDTKSSFRNGSERTRPPRDQGKTIMTNPEPRDLRLDFERRRQRGQMTPIPVEALDELLTHFSRSPASLSLVFLITRDRRMLLELRDHDDDPTAVAFLAKYSQSDEEHIYWAKRLAEIEPENALGKIVESNALMMKGKPEEALAALKAAEACPKWTGGLAGIRAILPEAASLLPEGQRVDIVFGDLNLATTESVTDLIPFNIRESLSKLPSEQAIEATQAYLNLLKKGASGSGFSVVEGEGLTDLDSLFAVKREVALGALTAINEKAALSLDPEPLKIKSERTWSQIKAWRKNRDNLTPAQVDSIVSQALSP